MKSAWQIPDDLWHRVQSAPHRLLITDYDGTLAPFRVERQEALPAEGVRDLLERLCAQGGTRLAVVSGRPVAELDRLLGGLPIRMAGEHGWEARAAGGRLVQYPIPIDSLNALRRAAEAAAAEEWGARVETKRASLVLHTRGLEAPEAARIEAAGARLWASAIRTRALRLYGARGGIELRVPGRHKGTAVRELLAESPPGTLPIYIGDDSTDEDAFAVVREAGFGVLVCDEARPSLARGRLPSIEDVATFLGTVLSRVDEAPREPTPRVGARA